MFFESFSNRFYEFHSLIVLFEIVLFACSNVPWRQQTSRWVSLVSPYPRVPSSLEVRTRQQDLSFYHTSCAVEYHGMSNFPKFYLALKQAVVEVRGFLRWNFKSHDWAILHVGICIDHNEANLGWMIVPHNPRYSQVIFLVGFDCVATFRRSWLICLTDMLDFLVSIRKVSHRSCIPSEAGK